MTQDQEFQPAYCRWAAEALGIDDAVSVEFIHEAGRQWSEITFEEASCRAVVTRKTGAVESRYIEFDTDLVTALLRAQAGVAA